MIMYEKKLYNLLPVIVLLGLLFKETTVVLCIAPFFFELSWEKRLKQIALAGGGFIVLKVIVDVAVGNPMPFFSPTIHPPGTESLRLMGNLSDLLRSPLIEHPLLINVCSLLALMVMPGKDRTMMMLKSIAIFFSLSIFVFGEIREFRIWLELAPLAVYAIAKHFYWGELSMQPADDLNARSGSLREV